MAEGTKIAEAHVDIVANMEGLRADLAKVKSVLQKVQAPAAQATSKFAKLTAIFTGITAVLNIVTFAFKAVGMIIGGISKLISGLATVIKTILVTAFNILKKIVTSVFGVIKGMLNLAIAGFKKLTTFIGSSISVQAEFGQSMARVGALTNTVGTRDFDSLRKKALDLGKATEFAAGEAADAMGNFAMAGFETNEIMQAVGPTLDFASANQLSLAESSDIAARVMGAMGVEASRTSDVMDALTIGATKTNQNVVDLGEAFKNAGSSASAAGVDLHMTTAALMVMADQGQRGSEAGSALKQVFLKMPSKNVTKMFGGFGIAMTTANGAMRPMPDLVDDLNRAIKGKGEFEKLNMLTEAFGTKAGPGMIKLLNAGGDAWRKYAKTVRGAAGETKRIADIQRNTLATSFKIVKSAADDLRIAVGDVFEPFIREGNERVVGMLNRIADFVRENTETIQKVIGDFITWFEGAWQTGAEVALGSVIFFWDELKAGWAATKSFFARVAGATGGFFGELFGIDKMPESATLLQKVFFGIATAISKVVSTFGRLWIELKFGFKLLLLEVTTAIKLFVTDIQDILDPTFGAMGLFSDALSPDEIRKQQQLAAKMEKASLRTTRDSLLGLQESNAARELQGAQDAVNAAFAGGDSRGRAAGDQAREIIEGVAGFLGVGVAGEIYPPGQEKPGFGFASKPTFVPGPTPIRDQIRSDERWAKRQAEIKARGPFVPPEQRRAEQRARDEHFLRVVLPKRRREAMREAVKAAGGVSAFLKKQEEAKAGPKTLSVVSAIGTISTVFGAMKVGLTEEVKLLTQLVKSNKAIASNTSGGTAGGLT